MNDQIDESEYDSAVIALYATVAVLSVVGIATTMIVGILGGYFG